MGTLFQTLISLKNKEGNRLYLKVPEKRKPKTLYTSGSKARAYAQKPYQLTALQSLSALRLSHGHTACSGQ